MKKQFQLLARDSQEYFLKRALSAKYARREFASNRVLSKKDWQLKKARYTASPFLRCVLVIAAVEALPWYQVEWWAALLLDYSQGQDWC